MLGGNIGYMTGDFDQFLATAVRLDDDALICLGDMMLETHDILETQFLAELCGDLHGLIVDRVAPVEANQRRGIVIAGEELGANKRPQRRVGVIIAHENRDFEFDIDTQAVEQITKQHGTGLTLSTWRTPYWV